MTPELSLSPWAPMLPFSAFACSVSRLEDRGLPRISCNGRIAACFAVVSPRKF